MSDEIGTYSFLPWLRQGIANKVTAPAGAAAKRSQIIVTLNVAGTGLTNPPGELVDKTIEICGPGDVVGVDPKAIVKTEPRNWITNFEPNYLPYIEFYDEDFPWRYTPSAPVDNRLTPWLSLVVLAEGEFDDGKGMLNRPLNYITLKKATEASAVFPPEADLWAWAHVHINKNIVGSSDNPISINEAAFIGQFKNVLSDNPDLAYSRILSPRKLDDNTAYHAFLMPTFESGRLAGLGHDPTGISGFGANTIAWAAYGGRQEEKSFPYYYRWYFRTGSVGDFEYLVRLLKPQVPDSRVGRRDIDVQDPGSAIEGIQDEQLKGILRLGGALQVPTACFDEEELAEYKNYEQWHSPYPRPFQRDLAAFINLADDYTRKTTADAHRGSTQVIKDDNPDDPDPLITPPLYGRWHALTSRLLTQKDGSPADHPMNWVHALNLDPRWRSVANFGTQVIQDKQEEYMDAAWEQVGDVLEANRRLRWAKLASFTSKVWYKKNIQPKAGVAIERYLTLTTPVQKRIVTDGKTVFYHVRTSRVPQALISAPMRRIIRPRARLTKRLNLGSAASRDKLISRVNQGEVTPAPPRVVPDELLTPSKLVDAVRPARVPALLLDLLQRYPWLQYLQLLLGALIILLLLLFGPTGVERPSAVGTVVAAALALLMWLRRLLKVGRDAAAILPGQQTPDAVGEFPRTPNFRVTEFGDSFVPASGATDSAEATHFKAALRKNYEFVQRSAAAGKLPVYTELDTPRVVDAIVAGIDPAVTIQRYINGHVSIPIRIVDALRDEFAEAMAYPEIGVPMYKPLLDLSSDHFLPNINLIEQNSITLLETNQPFIESYMVGLNHEFARELLWREYPTDQRGSYFRQFWDVSGYAARQEELNKLLKEWLKERKITALNELDRAEKERQIVKLGSGDVGDLSNLPDQELDEQLVKVVQQSCLAEKLRDIPPMHRWSRSSSLGDHDHREQGGEKENEVVLVIRGELLKKYPTAVIYAHRAKWATDGEGKRVLAEPRDFDDSEPEDVVIKAPLYEAKVEPDIYFFGFDLDVKEAKGDSGENEDDKAGWFFVIKERPGEPRFGLDVPGKDSDMDVTTLAAWSELAWSHVMVDVSAHAVGKASAKFITIDGTRTIKVLDPGPPGNDAEKQQQKEDSHVVWRSTINAAELAYILYQVPVLIGVHAAEMLPDKR